MLYEMATGHRAFSADTAVSTITFILRDEPKPISGDVSAVPRELERVVGRCLRKDPERRFQTATDVRNALEELGDEHTVHSAPVLTEMKSRNWKVLRDGIFLLDSQTNAQLGTAARVADARFYCFTTKKLENLGFPNPKAATFIGIDLTADATWVYYSQVDSSSSELQLVENLPFSERRR